MSGRWSLWGVSRRFLVLHWVGVSLLVAEIFAIVLFFLALPRSG